VTWGEERSGTCDSLPLVPGDKVVVLGLVTTSTSRVEPLEQIEARLGETSSVMDAERRRVSRGRLHPVPACSCPALPAKHPQVTQGGPAAQDDLAVARAE
jgi:hypothetical protein